MIAWDIVRRGVVTSTMDEVAVMARGGAPEGVVVVAEHQTAGRGRAGRTWAAPPGTALQCSVLLRPPVPTERLASLSLVVGVAVAEALESFGLAPALKWPNDVWLHDRKVAGILVTSQTGAGSPVVIAGIGVNLTAAEPDLPPGATSILAMSGVAPDREAVLAAVLDHLDAGYRSFVASDGRPDLSGWTARAALLGERVEVRDGGTTHQGEFIGIDSDGALLLRDDDGTTHRIVAGDLVRGPRQSI